MAKLSTSENRRYYRLYRWNDPNYSFLKRRITLPNDATRIYGTGRSKFDDGEYIDVRIPASKLLQVMYGSD